MRQALYPGEHTTIAESINTLGIAYENLGDFRNALDYYEKALKIRQALYQDNHPDIADSLYNVGLAYNKLRHVRLFYQIDLESEME
jgi:tetratricopeptide (TPR) repeat protein